MLSLVRPVDMPRANQSILMQFHLIINLLDIEINFNASRALDAITVPEMG